MARKKRTVADRQKSLQPVPPEANFTLAGVRAMYKGMGGKEFFCTISGHHRTQVFQFPRIDFHPDGNEPHHTIYTSPSVRACLASNLVRYFANATYWRHYAISPSLRHAINQADQEIRRQLDGREPVYLVIEESNEITPVEMTKGECSISKEVLEKEDGKIPMLAGGREGEEFLTAWATVNGAWPELPNNQQIINLILAGVRVAQRTPGPILKYVDQSCLVTDEGRFVVIVQPRVSARGETSTPMNTKAYRERASEIQKAIAAMESDIATPHMALLINSMYSDERKDDAYQRLQYLRLWQSLAETGRTCLGYHGNIKEDNVVIAGKKTLRELTQYRDDIAHWWTDSIDENYLGDLQQTINQLIHRKYF